MQEAFRHQNNHNKSQRQQSAPTSTAEDDLKFFLALPHHHPGSEALKSGLERFQIKLYFSYERTLAAFLSSNINPPSRSVNYEMQYECGESYMGETKVGLKQRMSQHYTLIEKYCTEAHSKIVQHHHEKRWQCMFDPSNTTILDIETDYQRRKINEAIYF